MRANSDGDGDGAANSLWLKNSTLFAPPFAPFTTLFAQCLNQFRVRQFRHFLVESQRGESRVIVCRRDQSIQQTTTFCRCQRIKYDLATQGFNQAALKHAEKGCTRIELADTVVMLKRDVGFTDHLI